MPSLGMQIQRHLDRRSRPHHPFPEIFLYALELQNLDSTNSGGTATGILFSTEGGGNFGKGAIVYARRNSWAMGTMHFLQNQAYSHDIPALSDAVMSIANNGNVGIGTSSPCSTLDVEGGKLVVQTHNSSYGQVQILNNGTSSTDTEASIAFAAGVTGGQGGTIQCPVSNLWMLGAGSYGNPATVFGIGNISAGGYILTVNSSGKVGIGTTNPGSTTLAIKVAGTSSSTSSLNVTDSSSNSHLFVRDDGNVGIGTASPGQKLEVNGNIKADGRIIIAGNAPSNSTGATGDVAGMIAWNSSYLYVCTANYNGSAVWKRVALSTF